MRRRKVAHGIQIGGQCRHGMGVVRHIQHQRGLARNDLKTSGQLHHGQARAHGLRSHRHQLAQRLICRQHARCIHELVGTTQGRIGQPGITTATPCPAPLLAVTLIVEVMTKAPEVCADLGRVIEHTLWRHGVAHDHRSAWTHDAGLLAANGFAVITQNGGVVDINAGDDGAVSIHHVRSVEPAAQAHFQNGDIQLGQTQHAQDGQRGELKIRQQDFFTLQACGFHGFKVRQKVLSLGDFTVNAATLLKMHQVWRGIDAGLIARLQGHGLQHGTGRALAVGASHRNDGAVKLQRHALRDFAYTLQAHGNVLWMNLLAVRKPLGKCGKSAVHTVRDCRAPTHTSSSAP